MHQRGARDPRARPQEGHRAPAGLGFGRARPLATPGDLRSLVGRGLAGRRHPEPSAAGDPDGDRDLPPLHAPAPERPHRAAGHPSGGPGGARPLGQDGSRDLAQGRAGRSPRGAHESPRGEDGALPRPARGGLRRRTGQDRHRGDPGACLRHAEARQAGPAPARSRRQGDRIPSTRQGGRAPRRRAAAYGPRAAARDIDGARSGRSGAIRTHDTLCTRSPARERLVRRSRRGTRGRGDRARRGPGPGGDRRSARRSPRKA